MYRLFVALTILIFSVSPARAGASSPQELKDLYFGEALYYAFQGDWFDAITRLDTELTQHHGLDEPERDTLYYHINHAEFAVGDFELAYRMHQRAGRAITAVIEGNVEEPVRNEAIYRLARIYFQKDQPVNALYAVERISGDVPPHIVNDLNFLRAQILMANRRYAEAADILKDLQDVKSLEGFSTYNLGIALIKDGKELEGRKYLDLTGRISCNDKLTLAIKDKSNLVLGSKLLEEKKFESAKQILDRVRLKGPFSNRALLGSGWADVFQGRFERAIVPWSNLVIREVTDASVQEAMLAAPYAYGKLSVYSKAALMYGSALENFDTELNKLDESIKSIREGHFLRALAREELKQDANWVVKLRKLPQTPETYYLLELMAAHDFQESLKNYLDLEQLRKKLEAWEGDLDAFEEIIEQRRAYYQPLLPAIDREFRQLDSQMRLRLEQRDRIEQRLKKMLVVPRPDYLATLRLEQRDRIEQRLKKMLVVPRPDYLATSTERIISEQIWLLEQSLSTSNTAVIERVEPRIKRLRGLLHWNIYTEYDRRFTETYRNLLDLNHEVDLLKTRYKAFVRTRQAATQSYEGYDDVIRRQRFRIREAWEKVQVLMARQGHMLEIMAVNELTNRRERLAEFQIKARFAMAESYDRAARAHSQEEESK
jgi:hypothetical protein